MPLLPSHDLRGAARALLRAPTLALSAIVCLGLGLGATAALSSAIDRALLQPLPVRDPGRLVTVYRTTPNFKDGPFAVGTFTDLARDPRTLESLAAFTAGWTPLLTAPDGGVQLQLVKTTGSFFPMLGARALRGRLLEPGDDRDGAPAVVVVSEEMWRTRFGGDPSLVGRVLELDGEPTQVVGILPNGFRVPAGSGVAKADVWAPIRFNPAQRSDYQSNYLRLMGRLAPSATVEQADAELRARFASIIAAHPEVRGQGVRALALQAESTRSFRGQLLLLFGAVCMVLLIAAANVASLLLARGIWRRREMAVRTALGGSRLAVMRPVLAEALLLTASGLVVGLVLAWVGVKTIGALAAQRLPQLDGLGLDWRVLAFAALLAVVVAALCGGVPAWRSAAVDPQDALRDGRGGGTGAAHHRALGALVVGEVALSLVLLTGAGLVMKGFARLATSDPGFDPAPLLTLKVSGSAKRYPDLQGVTRFLEPSLDAIRALPGVESAASILLIPYDNWGWNSPTRYEGRPDVEPTSRPIVENRVATPELFQTLGMRLIAGRLLRASDDERPTSPQVVVVNQALAKRDFPGEDPVGKRFYTSDTTLATIVGVVSDIKNVGPFRAPAPEMYQSWRQAGAGWTSFPIVVRAKRGLDPRSLAASVRGAVHGVDPTAAVADISPLTDIMAKSIGRPRFYLTLLGAFAAVALVLALAGLYGVMSYVVAQRTRELGIRTALGSPAARTLALVASRGARLIVFGVILGLAGSAAVTRLMTGMLYDVSPLDPTTWLLATLLLVAVGVLATLIPALRATRIDPLEAMRVE